MPTTRPAAHTLTTVMTANARNKEARRIAARCREPSTWTGAVRPWAVIENA